jgi:hypothetical protein
MEEAGRLDAQQLPLSHPVALCRTRNTLLHAVTPVPSLPSANLNLSQSVAPCGCLSICGGVQGLPLNTKTLNLRLRVRRARSCALDVMVFSELLPKDDGHMRVLFPVNSLR